MSKIFNLKVSSYFHFHFDFYSILRFLFFLFSPRNEAPNCATCHGQAYKDELAKLGEDGEKTSFCEDFACNQAADAYGSDLIDAGIKIRVAIAFFKVDTVEHVLQLRIDVFEVIHIADGVEDKHAFTA